MSDDHKPRRQKRSPPPTAARETVDEPCPGPKFTIHFEGGRKATLNLEGLKRPVLAIQAAELVWDKAKRQAPSGSLGLVALPQAAMRHFCEHLGERDPENRVECLQDIEARDVDAFDEHLRALYPTSNMSQKHLQAFMSLLRDADAAGLVQERLRPRLAYHSVLPPVGASTPREPFSAREMTNLRTAATTGVKEAVRRRCRGERRIRNGGEPVTCGLPSADDLAWAASIEGPPGPMTKVDIERFRVRCDVSIAAILGEVYPSSVDAVAFSVLIAEETGIPIESVRDLRADCLRDERDGHATLHYLKRRAGKDGNKTMDVTTRKRFSAGWLINLFLGLSKHARRHAGAEVREWLFVGYAQRRILRLEWGQPQVGAFLKRYQVKDEAGGPMVGAQLSRIRKNVKAASYRRVGGDLKLFANDHSRQVSATHYARIAANVEIHEAAIAKGLQAALDVRTRTAVHPAEEPAEAGDDVAVAQCLDFDQSPYSPPGRPCGAPLLGCLDCANAVVSEAKLPALLHLLHDLVQKRQEMNLGGWMASFGTAYARILMILDLFPQATVEAALKEAANDYGRSWSPAQLAFKV